MVATKASHELIKRYIQDGYPPRCLCPCGRPSHKSAPASITAINSDASAISTSSGVGANPSSAGPTVAPREFHVASEGHCQSKIYTACSRIKADWSSTVFAHELTTRSAGFDGENRLYLFALTMPNRLVGFRTDPRWWRSMTSAHRSHRA